MLSTSSTIETQESFAVLRSRRGQEVFETQESVMSGGAVSLDWFVQQVPKGRPRPVTINKFRPVPPQAHEFVRNVATIDGIKCVIVEEEDNHVVHVTTFAKPLTEALREAVYDVEMNMIASHPELTFDFHLRDLDEASGAVPEYASGGCYFAIWGGFHADAR